MGMDLYLVKKSDYSTYLKRDSEHHAIFPDEVIYGRKVWGIFYWFRNHNEYTKLFDPKSEQGYNFEITLESYVELCDRIKKYKKTLDKIEQQTIQNVRTNHKAYDIIEDVLGMHACWLGDDWECVCLLQILEHEEEVKNIYANGDSLILECNY